jgi:imidazole glycerol phosphate synthase subunit HisF
MQKDKAIVDVNVQYKGWQRIPRSRCPPTVEAMGAGEIFLNRIDKDVSGGNFDLKSINDVKAAAKIPVIAS